MKKLIMPVVAILILTIFPTPINAALAAPPNFRLDRAFTISLAVTWDKPAYAVRNYIIYKDGVIYRHTGTTNFNIVQGLTDGKSYSLYVKAVDMHGNLSNPYPAIKVSTTKTNYDGFTTQEILYSHLQDIKVQAGDMVSTGQVIGTIDWKDKSHLHFGITVDAPNIYFVAGNNKWKYDWVYNYNRDQIYALPGLTSMK